LALELKIVALTRHADCDPPDAILGVEPRVERPEGAVVGRAWKPGEAQGCPQELAALVEHPLLGYLGVTDHIVSPVGAFTPRI